MAKIPLQVIDESEIGERELINREGPDTVVMHGGDPGHDYVCAQCGATLMAGIHEHQIQNTVIKCAACGAFNDTGS